MRPIADSQDARRGILMSSHIMLIAADRTAFLEVLTDRYPPTPALPRWRLEAEDMRSALAVERQPSQKDLCLGRNPLRTDTRGTRTRHEL
jgi:hypothetical protein